MGLYVGLDVSLKRTAVWILDEHGGLVWEGWADTHPEMIFRLLERWQGELASVGLETGSMTPGWRGRSRGLGCRSW
jgi:transposase